MPLKLSESDHDLLWPINERLEQIGRGETPEDQEFLLTLHAELVSATTKTAADSKPMPPPRRRRFKPRFVRRSVALRR